MSLNYTDLVDAIRAAIGERPELLTKREWFAGMALMGLCANPARFGDDPPMIPDDVDLAVIFADALIERLDEKEQP